MKITLAFVNLVYEKALKYYGNDINIYPSAEAYFNKGLSLKELQKAFARYKLCSSSL